MALARLLGSLLPTRLPLSGEVDFRKAKFISMGAAVLDNPAFSLSSSSGVSAIESRWFVLLRSLALSGWRAMPASMAVLPRIDPSVAV